MANKILLNDIYGSKGLFVRVEKLEQHLTAIERAATCGTGPNEPYSISPAQADVGEASESSKPTPGMLAAGRVLATNNYHGDPVGAAEEIAAHVGPELDTLRAENERLRMEAIGHEDDCHEANKRADEACRQLAENGKQLADANATIATLTRERDEARTKLAQGVDLHGSDLDLWGWHHDVRGLLGITSKQKELEPYVCVADAKLLQENADLKSQLATHRESAAAMEVIGKFNYIHLSKRPRGDWQAQFGSGRPGYGPTPTAAILAAKAAVKKGGE